MKPTMAVCTRALLALTLIAGCASGSPRPRPAMSGSDPEVLTVEEIRASSQADAYSLVRSVRPQWLRPRGPRSINMSGEIVVYLDGTRFGGANSLRQIPLTDVVSMRYMDSSTATQRYGTGHTSGAILVFTR